MSSKCRSGFRHRGIGDGEGCDEFIQDGGAVGFFCFERPVGIVRIDDAKMSLVQMRQHSNEFCVAVAKNCVAGFQVDVLNLPAPVPGD